MPSMPVHPGADRPAPALESGAKEEHDHGALVSFVEGFGL